MRDATNAENTINSGAYKTNRCGTRGVFLARTKWIAQIKVSGKSRHLGSFLTKESAAKAYKQAAIAEFGEFASGYMR